MVGGSLEETYVKLEMNVTQVQTQSDEEGGDGYYDDEESNLSPLKNTRKKFMMMMNHLNQRLMILLMRKMTSGKGARKTMLLSLLTFVVVPGLRQELGTVGTPLLDKNKDRHEFAPSGFQSPARAGHILIAYRSLLKWY
jgi:hypothetical protein